MAVISRPLDLLELMRELYTEKWNPAAESKEAGLNFFNTTQTMSYWGNAEQICQLL